MICKTIPILDKGASLVLNLHEVRTEWPILQRPTILIMPGGGYECLSDREGECIAATFYAMGYHTAVLMYSIKENARNWQPMLEGYEAIRILRANAKEWHIIPDQIAACGFSAGAHLAGSLGVMWRRPEIVAKLGCCDRSCQPNALILCYPVLTGGEFSHRSSMYWLSGEKEDCEATRAFSVDTMVRPDTPPTFIWHTADDDVAPIENTLIMAQALQKNKVPFEVHIFDKGPHGMALACPETGFDMPHVAHWMKLCEEWLHHVLPGEETK